jgi:hypothetical protein
VVFELLEPDEALPIGLPSDDLACRGVIKAAQEGLEEGDLEGFERALREALGDDLAEQVFREMDRCHLVLPWLHLATPGFYCRTGMRSVCPTRMLKSVRPLASIIACTVVP